MTRRDDPIPLHRKFGYQHMIEMQQIEAELAAELGVDPTKFNPQVYFGARRRYEERHRGDPTYRQKSEARRALIKPMFDPFRDALERIAAGHNDPRSLAKQVLGQDHEEKSD